MNKRKKRNKSRNIISRQPLFAAFNYGIIGLGVALIATGFTVMYMENKVNGFISLFISPLLILGGYGTIIYAIMARRNGDSSGKPEMSS